MPPTQLPPGVTFDDVVAAGIPVTPAPNMGGTGVSFLPHATPSDFEALMALFDSASNPAIHTQEERAALTTTWLTAKACLDVLPAVEQGADDPYTVARQRLVNLVQSAEEEMNNAGGPV